MNHLKKKKHLMEHANKKCSHIILCFGKVNVQKYSFITQFCDAGTMNLGGMMVKKKKRMVDAPICFTHGQVISADLFLARIFT